MPNRLSDALASSLSVLERSAAEDSETVAIGPTCKGRTWTASWPSPPLRCSPAEAESCRRREKACARSSSISTPRVRTKRCGGNRATIEGVACAESGEKSVKPQSSVVREVSCVVGASRVRSSSRPPCRVALPASPDTPKATCRTRNDGKYVSATAPSASCADSSSRACKSSSPRPVRVACSPAGSLRPRACVSTLAFQRIGSPAARGTPRLAAGGGRTPPRRRRPAPGYPRWRRGGAAGRRRGAGRDWGRERASLEDDDVACWEPERGGPPLAAGKRFEGGADPHRRRIAAQHENAVAVRELGQAAARGQRLEHAGAPLQGVLPGVGHLAQHRHRQRARLLDRHGDPGNIDVLFQSGLDLLGEHAG